MDELLEIIDWNFSDEDWLWGNWKIRISGYLILRYQDIDFKIELLDWEIDSAIGEECGNVFYSIDPNDDRLIPVGE